MSEILQGIDPRKQASFSLANRLARLAWAIAEALLFKPSPRPFHRWRAWLLRRFGARIGRGVHIYPGARIWAPWQLVCEDEAAIADGVQVYSMAPITLGRRAIVSQGAHLCTGTHDYQSPAFQLYALPIVIGAEAWVCAEAFVHPGVTIGEGAVIGARAVVTRDMPAWTVCAGHPCKPLKPRVLKEDADGCA